MQGCFYSLFFKTALLLYVCTMKKWIVLTTASLVCNIAMADDSVPVTRNVNRTIWGSPWFWTLLVALLILLITTAQSITDKKENKSR